MSSRCFTRSYLSGNWRPLMSLMVLLAVSSWGCGGGSSDGGGDSCDVPTLFAEKCGGSICHGQGAGHIDLVSGNINDRVANATGIDCPDGVLADPSDPEGSLLYQKVADTHTCGSLMPLGGIPLTDDEVTCIRDWISGLLPPQGSRPDAGVECPECECFPLGVTETCYSGEDGTAGIGVCQTGTRTCVADGTAFSWGECVGEVVPRNDNCTTAEDEDCDSVARACGPAWSTGFGSYYVPDDSGLKEDTVLRSTTIDSNGNVFFLGEFDGTVSFGGDALTADSTQAKSDIVLGKYDKDGNYLWSKRFGDTSNQYASKIITDSADNIIIVLRPFGVVNLGGGELDGIGEFDIVVAKFDNDGVWIWDRLFSGMNKERAERVTVDGNDDVILTGVFSGTTSFGATSPTSTGVNDAFVIKLDGATGNNEWVQHFVGTGDNDYGWGVAVDGANNVYAAGYFDAAITIGTDTHNSAGDKDIYLAKISSGGVIQWSQRFGSTGDDAPFDLERNPVSGDIAMIGYFSETVDFGLGGLTSAGSRDIFLATFDTDGDNQMAKRYGDAEDQFASAIDNMWHSLEIDSTGRYYIAGNLSGAADFGAGSIGGGTTGRPDVFFVKLNALGVQEGPADSGVFGSATISEGALDIGVGPDGEFAIVGRFAGSSITFAGSGTVTRTGGQGSGTDSFLVHFE